MILWWRHQGPSQSRYAMLLFRDELIWLRILIDHPLSLIPIEDADDCVYVFRDEWTASESKGFYLSFVLSWLKEMQQKSRLSCRDEWRGKVITSDELFTCNHVKDVYLSHDVMKKQVGRNERLGWGESCRFTFFVSKNSIEMMQKKRKENDFFFQLNLFIMSIHSMIVESSQVEGNLPPHRCSQTSYFHLHLLYHLLLHKRKAFSYNRSSACFIDHHKEKAHQGVVVLVTWEEEQKFPLKLWDWLRSDYFIS